MPQRTGSSVNQLRQDAKKSIEQVLYLKTSPATIIALAERRFGDALRSDDEQQLSDAFFHYQQGASLLAYAIGLPEVKQSPKGSDIQKKIVSLQLQLSQLAPRSSAIEAKLRELDDNGSNSEFNGDIHTEPETKPGGSIADRLRSLQDAGMTINVPRRLTKESRLIDDPPFLATEKSDLSTSSLSYPAITREIAHPYSPNIPPSPNIKSTFDPHSSTSELRNFESQSSGGSRNGTVQLSGSVNSRIDALSISSESLKSRSAANSPIVGLDDFASSYPSLDELDARQDWVLPSVPLTEPGFLSQSSPAVSSTFQSPLHSAIPNPSPVHATLPTPDIPSKRHPSRERHLRPASTPTIPFLSNTSKPRSSPLSSPISTESVPALKAGNKPLELPTASSVFPHQLAEWHRAGYKLLILDVRTREQFENQRLSLDSVCIEPSILMRQSISSQQIESALVISPTSEQNMFSNRDTYDLVIVVDQESTSIAASSPLSSLFRAIYEFEFKKNLKRPPLLLVGGMAAWRHDMGMELIEGRRQETRDDADLSLRNPSVVDTSSTEQTSLLSVDAGSSLSLLSRSNLPEIANISSNSKQIKSPSPPIPNMFVRTPSSPSIHYPRPASTVSSSTFGSYTDSRRLPMNGDILTPPPASLASASAGRRRTDIVERWQPSYPSQPSLTKSIDYPALTPQPVLSQPPIAASPVLERQDHRRLPQPQQMSLMVPPKIPSLLIPANYTVTSWGDVELGVSGLKNLGNTCWMNSTLQCISATVPFVRFFQDGSWKSAVNMINPLGSKGHLAQSFASMVSDMWRHEYTYLSPLTFRKGFCQREPQFGGSNQHDAQEFLSSLLDGLHEDLNRVLQKPPPLNVTPDREAELERLPPQIASAQEWMIYRMRNDSLVVDYFQGQFRNRLECMTCHHTSTTYNAFMYLSLPLPTSRSSGTSLYQCLDAFVSAEIMEKEDAWNCPHCKTLRKATKQLSLSRLPPVLLIQLKRFSFNGPFTDKLETAVDYPVKGLDLTKYIPPIMPGSESDKSLSATDPRRQEPPYFYDLYGVTNHFGTLSSGHYTAYVASKGRWLLCDDSRVSSVTERDIVGRPAYILYYKRRGATVR